VFACPGLLGGGEALGARGEEAPGAGAAKVSPFLSSRIDQN